jgi:hypothetical protein
MEEKIGFLRAKERIVADVWVVCLNSGESAGQTSQKDDVVLKTFGCGAGTSP